MLSNELISQIKHLELKARRMATDVLSGNYASAFHGRGLDFQEVREYSPGDDIRAIDWNVTARTSVPHIKVYREERELTVMLAVDISASVRSASLESCMKKACELAAVIAWLAIRNNDRVGLILFTDQIEYYVPPKKGRGHVWMLIKNLFSFEPKGKGTNLKAVCDFLEKTQKRRCTTFLISDFWSDDFENSLKRCAARHDLTCVKVEDSVRANLPDAGLVRFFDSESGQFLLLNTSDQRVRQAYSSHSNSQVMQKKMITKAGADFFTIRTNESVVKPLVEYLRGHFGKRQKINAGSF